MTRWMYPPEVERPRQPDAFDPVLEGDRHGLSRELALAIWNRVCADASDCAGRRDEEQTRQRFHEIAARFAAGAGRLRRDPGRVTRVGVEIRGDSSGSWLADLAAPSAPGRRTLADDVPSPRLGFEDYCVLGLQDMLRHLGPNHPLKPELIAAAAVADRSSAGRATLWRESLPMTTTSHGQAVWHAAERRAVTLYRRAVADVARPDDPAVALAMQRIGGGQPLPAGVRHAMEQRLGVALDRVRVHTDAVAGEAARALSAEAFTVGEDIFFAEHAFAPETERGMKLLAHELAHVVQAQQRRTESGDGELRISHPHDHLENEAESVAAQLGSPPGTADATPGRGRIAAEAIAGKGGGAPLPAPLSAYFGTAYDTDLSTVRVHTDTAAQRSVARAEAKAFAFGTDIFFGAGEYDPASPGGLFLIAHELAHIAQHQRAQPAAGTAALETGQTGDVHEVAATAAATAALSGHKSALGAAPPRVRFFAQDEGPTPGGGGHARLTEHALHGMGGLSDAEVRTARHGNWERDLSQLLTPTTVSLGLTAPDRPIMVVLNILSIDEFHRGINLQSFGTYDPVEHIDNPTGLRGTDVLDQGGMAGMPAHHPDGANPDNAASISGDHPAVGAAGTGHQAYADLDERYRHNSHIAEGNHQVVNPQDATAFQVDESAIPNYIYTSRDWCTQTLRNAARLGTQRNLHSRDGVPLDETLHGPRMFSSGAHTLQDYFAHSNFCEVAINILVRRGGLRVATQTAETRDAQGHRQVRATQTQDLGQVAGVRNRVLNSQAHANDRAGDPTAANFSVGDPSHGGREVITTGSFNLTDTIDSLSEEISAKWRALDPFRVKPDAPSPLTLAAMDWIEMDPRNAADFGRYARDIADFIHPVIASISAMGTAGETAVRTGGGLVAGGVQGVAAAESGALDLAASGADWLHAQLGHGGGVASALHQRASAVASGGQQAARAVTQATNTAADGVHQIVSRLTAIENDFRTRQHNLRDLYAWAYAHGPLDLLKESARAIPVIGPRVAAAIESIQQHIHAVIDGMFGTLWNVALERGTSTINEFIATIRARTNVQRNQRPVAAGPLRGARQSVANVFGNVSEFYDPATGRPRISHGGEGEGEAGHYVGIAPGSYTPPSHSEIAKDHGDIENRAGAAGSGGGQVEHGNWLNGLAMALAQLATDGVGVPVNACWSVVDGGRQLGPNDPMLDAIDARVNYYFDHPAANASFWEATVRSFVGGELGPELVAHLRDAAGSAPDAPGPVREIPPQPPASAPLHRKARDANGVAPGAELAVASAARGAGSALPADIQRAFEASLGTDLSGVRLHAGAASAAAAHSVAARAYTVGQDIHFGAGQYDPASEPGKRLLAHEVAHTVQQRGAAPRVQNKLEVSSPGDAAEVEADTTADAMLHGARATLGSAPGGLDRALLRDKDPGAGQGIGDAQAGGALGPNDHLSVTFPTATLRVSWLAEQGVDLAATSQPLPLAVGKAILSKVREQVFHWATPAMIEAVASDTTIDCALDGLEFVTLTMHMDQLLEAFGLPPGASVHWVITNDGSALLTVAASQFAKLSGYADGGDANNIAFEDAGLSKRIWDDLMAKTGLNARVMVKLVGHPGNMGVVRQFSRDEFAALVGEEELDDYLDQRAREKAKGEKGAPTAGGSGNAPEAGPGAAAGDASAAKARPDAAADDSGTAGDSGTGADASAPRPSPDPHTADPGAAKADPKDPAPIGPPAPIHGDNASADPATAKKSVDEIMKLYEFLLTNFPDHPAFKQGKTAQDFVSWLSQQTQDKSDQDFTYVRPRGQWLTFLDKWDRNERLTTPVPDAEWPESMLSFQPQGTIALDPPAINGRYVVGSWVTATVEWAAEGMNVLLAQNANRAEYRWSVAGSKPGDVNAHLGQEIWEGDLSKLISIGVTTRGQNTFRFTFPREGVYAFRCVATSAHFEQLKPYTMTSTEVTAGTLQSIDQKQFDDHAVHSIDGPFEYVDGELRVRPGIQPMTIEDQITALNKMVTKIGEAQKAGTMSADECKDLVKAIQDKIDKLKEVGVGLEHGHAYVISGTLTPDTHGAGGPVAFLMYGTETVEAGKVTYDVRLIDQTGGKAEVHNGSGTGPEGAAGKLAAEKAAIAAAAAHFTSWNHLPDGQVHVGIQLLSNGTVEQQTWSTHNTLKTVEEQAGNAAAWVGRIALATAVIGTDGLASTVIELGAAGLTVVTVGAGQVQRGATGTLGDDKVKEVLDASKIALALAGPLVKTNLGKRIPAGFVAIALPAGNHLVMAAEESEKLEAINQEANAKLATAATDEEKKRINDDRQAKINQLLYQASQEHLLMAVQDTASAVHGAGKHGSEEAGSTRGTGDEQAGRPSEQAGRPGEKTGGQPDEQAGRPGEKTGGHPDEQAGRPGETVGGQPDERTGQADDTAPGEKTHGQPDEQADPHPPADLPAKAKEARRSENDGGRDLDAEAEAAGDPREAVSTVDVGAERAAVKDAVDALAASDDPTDRNTAEAIRTRAVVVRTRGELIVTHAANGEVFTLDPHTGESVVWSKGTKAVASLENPIVYVDPAAEGADLAADLRHEINHALHISDHDSRSRHNSLSRYADEFRAHWAAGDHDPDSVKREVLANYKDLQTEYLNDPEFQKRVDAITRPDGNVINSVRLEPVYAAIDRFEMIGEKPSVGQLAEWLSAMDVSDGQTLAADGRFRRWFHEQLELSPADRELLLGMLPPEAAKPAPSQ